MGGNIISDIELGCNLRIWWRENLVLYIGITKYISKQEK